MILNKISIKFEAQKVLKAIAMQTEIATGIPIHELQGSSRRWEISIVRLYFIAYCLGNGFRQCEIAEFLDRDYSTIWGIYTRFAESMKDFQWVRNNYEQFREKLDGALGTSKKAG